MSDSASKSRGTPAIKPIEVAADDERDRGGVQSVERAFALIEEVARHRSGIRLADLARRIGLHTSTTFHLVKTMVGLGYLRQMPDDKSYRIGAPLFTLAAGALDEVEMASLARPVLEELSIRTGEASHFAVRSGDDIVTLVRVAGTGAFQMTDRVGAVRPAHCTAIGKIMLAELDDTELEAYLRRRPPTAFTPKSITDVGRLVDEIRRVRAGGIAYDDSEYNVEARCIAVAVRDFTGVVRGAIGISGAVWRLSLQALDEKAALVRGAAANLSAELGYAPQREAPVTAAPDRRVRRLRSED